MFEQIGIFDGTQKFKIGNRPIRLIELFAGIGAQAKALENLGVDFEHYRICEFDKYAVASYNAIHGTDFETSDITQIAADDLGIVDTDKYCYIMTYSFPCGLPGTKVLTKNGYKNIEGICVNDYVLTHTNTFQRVSKTMLKIVKSYISFKALGVPQLNITPNHPLYVYRNGEFKWVKAKDLSVSDYFTFNINENQIDCNLDNKYLWLLGRYVADGWINPKHYNSVAFAIGKDKANQFEMSIPKSILDKAKVYQKTCAEYRVADRVLQDYCKQFGNGAKNKKIPQWVIDLPKEKLQSFFDGYIAGDGHIRKRVNTNQIMFSTTSENLFLGLQQIIAKLYGTICSCSIRKDDRKPTFNDTYNGQFSITNNYRHQKIVGNKIITKIKSIEHIDKQTPVFNLEVENDNSYTMQNVIVHNCQDLSLAGNRKGMARGGNTRSGLLWEVERLLDECAELPQVLLMENVPQVHGANNKKDFYAWINKLESLGYKNYYKDLNAKNYGIPQNRNRCFMISLLGDYYYSFPKRKPLKLKLKDMLESKVDEKYYLLDEIVDKMDCSQFVKVEREREREPVAKTVRTSGRCSLDRHSWDIIGELRENS